jgi:hypothetical protein
MEFPLPKASESEALLFRSGRAICQFFYIARNLELMPGHFLKSYCDTPQQRDEKNDDANLEYD